MSLQERVRLHRQKWTAAGQWQDPNLADCLDFMATEVAEAIDKRLRLSAAYTRNNAEAPPSALEMGVEIFDAIMMGCIALDLLDLNLEEVATIKLREMDTRKGVA